ncbi:hypothetical protein FSP39_001927 [Pinctada imbricata]|uniref:SGNH hydrolase-type esterase domain-containing protein n=1 Tax=Pinctada imbricata TaxID=66713 RepID=A0AA88Y1K1_PINIB|nr:hypothetical protein FSP39_001927 [Pinctada imbricata]
MKSASDLVNFRLDTDQFQIFKISSKDGLTIDKLSTLVQFEQTVPDICYLQVGSNDVGKISKDRIVDSIIAFAEYLLFGVGIRRVIIGQLLRRDPKLVKYNEMVIAVNVKLEEKVKTKNENIVFWKHRGFWKDYSHLGRDGVHLKNPKHKGKLGSSSPMHKYWRSIRNSLILHSKTLM